MLAAGAASAPVLVCTVSSSMAGVLDLSHNGRQLLDCVSRCQTSNSDVR